MKIGLHNPLPARFAPKSCLHACLPVSLQRIKSRLKAMTAMPPTRPNRLSWPSP